MATAAAAFEPHADQETEQFCPVGTKVSRHRPLKSSAYALHSLGMLPMTAALALELLGSYVRIYWLFGSAFSAFSFFFLSWSPSFRFEAGKASMHFA